MRYTPQEIEVWYILPAIRAELTKQMIQLGVSQADVAKKLNVSRAAVTQYVKNKRAIDFEFDEPIRKQIKISAKRILEDSVDHMKEFQIICDNVRETGMLCQFHKKIEAVDTECSICPR